MTNQQVKDNLNKVRDCSLGGLRDTEKLNTKIQTGYELNNNCRQLENVSVVALARFKPQKQTDRPTDTWTQIDGQSFCSFCYKTAKISKRTYIYTKADWESV